MENVLRTSRDNRMRFHVKFKLLFLTLTFESSDAYNFNKNIRNILKQNIWLGRMLADDYFYRRYENCVLKDLPNKDHMYINIYSF